MASPNYTLKLTLAEANEVRLALEEHRDKLESWLTDNAGRPKTMGSELAKVAEKTSASYDMTKRLLSEL